MRLLTRSNFDGLGCAVLLKALGLLDEIKFVHPKDVQDGKIEVTANDVLANVPCVEGCGLWFDHHSSEQQQPRSETLHGLNNPSAPSTARVIYDFYGGDDWFCDAHISDLVAAVDKSDAADYTVDEILHPTGWVLVSFIMDPRTGLGRYKDYRIGNYQLMMELIDHCRTMTADKILQIPDVQERAKRYLEQDQLFREMIQANTAVRDNVVVLDLRNQEEIYTGNRFVLYGLYPEQNVSIQVIWGLRKQNIVMACGHSIINHTCKTDIGSLMLKYGGGGHGRVGTCQVPTDQADTVLEELIQQMNADARKPDPAAVT